jgi:glycosyltransferase involved in cell wall biosynthesis
MKSKRVVYIGNNPTPYRIPVFNEVARQPDFEFLTLFSTAREPMREWDLPAIEFAHEYMDVRYFNMRSEPVHLNWDVVKRLTAYRPDLIVISGFNPTCLLAYVHALLTGAKLGLAIDGTPQSESHLSWLHRMVRAIVCPKICLFLGPSDQTLALFDDFGAKPQEKFKTHLCANNAIFSPLPAGETPEYDLIFCGRFADRKNPLFAIDVAARVSEMLNREVSLLMVGSGPMEAEARAHAARQKGVRCSFPGFASQAQLPAMYRQAKVFLFPTSDDPWGVVANEACATGLPVVVTPHAGVVGELVIDQVNGHVIPLDLQRWAQAVADLLTQPDTYARMSAQSLELVKGYTYAHAAQGLIAGIRYALKSIRR